MAQKIYGPIRGAGVQIIEKEGDKTIEPGALGMVGYAGMFEKGMVNQLVFCQNKTQFLKKMGSYIADGQAPDACIDYYDGANGAGGIWLIRITDGNELPAEKTLYARYGSILTPMGTLKAKNGGRWGGKKAEYTNDVSASGDIAETALTTGVATWKADQWKGGWLELADVPNKRYPIIGNTEAGVISVATDQTMKTDYGSGTSLRYYLYLENEGKEVTFVIREGEEQPDAEFALDVYVDGAGPVVSWPNLNTDPTSARYWVNLINNDGRNDEVEAVNLWTGAHTASVRPANAYGVIGSVTATVLTAVIHDFAINSPGGGDPTFALGTTTDEMLAQKITITMTSATEGDAVSDKFGALGSVTLGTLFTPNNKWTPPFTVTAGGTALAATDTLVINYKPFVADQLINGSLYPDKVNAKRTFFRIVDNDHKTITVADGSDLTADGEADDEFLVIAPTPLEGGRDGHADVGDAEYNSQAWDTGVSPYNRLLGKNAGVVKFATPGVTSTAVQKAGVAYAKAKNHQYRYEIPSNKITEQEADEYVNETLGRSDYAVVSFPSYAYVPDPEAGTEGKWKLVTCTGMIHGAEASVAKNYEGYHKAEAGVDVVLAKILDLPTGDAILDEEYLNPLGIGLIKKNKGNYILWGDRTLWTDSTWKWKHQRELMSYYENVLRENFDWIVFAINDPAEQPKALVALQAYFLPEWQKRAIRGDTFQDAAIIKIDAENNTDVTRAAGDMFADIGLRLADTVERFRIRIGKQGIFEAAA